MLSDDRCAEPVWLRIATRRSPPSSSLYKNIFKKKDLKKYTRKNTGNNTQEKNHKKKYTRKNRIPHKEKKEKKT